jgi:hypothetical protein
MKMDTLLKWLQIVASDPVERATKTAGGSREARRFAGNVREEKGGVDPALSGATKRERRRIKDERNGSSHYGSYRFEFRLCWDS